MFENKPPGLKVVIVTFTLLASPLIQRPFGTDKLAVFR